jgi:hypothetical protein
MKPIPITPETEGIAQRVIWFESPDVALSEPVRFMAYAFCYGTFEDMARLGTYIGSEDMIHALDNAPPGIIDPRSWAYWHLMLKDQSPPPPMPVRRFE